MIRIDRCVCFKQRFAELKEVADTKGVGTLEELQEHVSFGLECGLCRPYVRRMLQTGQTVFDEIIADDDEPV